MVVSYGLTLSTNWHWYRPAVPNEFQAVTLSEIPSNSETSPSKWRSYAILLLKVSSFKLLLMQCFFPLKNQKSVIWKLFFKLLEWILSYSWGRIKYEATSPEMNTKLTELLSNFSLQSCKQNEVIIYLNIAQG